MATYTRIEYLGANGNNWIATGITADINDTEMEFEGDGFVNSSAQIIVASSSSFRLVKFSASQKVGATCGSQVTSTVDGTSQFTAKLNKDGLWINGSLVGTFTIPSPVPSVGNIDIFRGNYSETSYYAGAGNVRKVIIRKNGLIVFNGLPVRRNEDDVLGLYDSVSETLFVNSGSGTFTAGPDIPEPPAPTGDVHWQVKFKSLRANELYTVNIYDDNYSGSPIQLIGAADPFVTHEDSDDDMFMPVRRQSGYIRIVDTGRDATDTVNVNWRSIIPTTDTDRPVTLTDSGGNVRWIGFMQAQNFGADMYRTPVEREFPVQCPLSVISRVEVDVNTNTMNRDIRNFAYLLKSALDTIPYISRPTEIVVQGGSDALEWLKVQVDWINFVQEDDDHNPESRYDYGTILEDMCKFWGLTARMHGETLYLTCADDSGESTALVMDYSELTTLASGTDDGSIETMFSSVSVGDIFASTNNKDYQNRGPNTCEINVDPDTYDGHSIDPFDDVLVTNMQRPDWNDGYIESNGDKMWHYTEDVETCQQMDLNGTCYFGWASFNILSKYRGQDAGGGYDDVGNVIHIKKTYIGAIYVLLKTRFEHCFSDGFLRILADTYREGEKYELGRFFAGDPAMKAVIGIENSMSSAIYWDGRAWQNSLCECLLTIGNKKPELFSRYEVTSTNYEETSIIPIPSGVTGRLFIELRGTDDNRVTDINGEKCFDLKDFRVEYYKNDNTSYQQYPNSGWCDIHKNLDVPRLRYKAHSDSMVKEEYNIDSPYGSNQGVPPAYGLLMNADGSYMENVQYYGARERPEVHLCNRVVNYWATSKRKIECELLAHDDVSATVADSINPRDLMSIDGSTMYPISISRDWRDDVVMLTMMEV